MLIGVFIYFFVVVAMLLQPGFLLLEQFLFFPCARIHYLLGMSWCDTGIR